MEDGDARRSNEVCFKAVILVTQPDHHISPKLFVLRISGGQKSGNNKSTLLNAVFVGCRLRTNVEYCVKGFACSRFVAAGLVSTVLELELDVEGRQGFDQLRLIREALR